MPLPVNPVSLLSSMCLVGIRLSGLFVFAPIFSSEVIAPRIKVCMLLTLMFAVGSSSGVSQWSSITPSSFAGEFFISFLFGFSLGLFLEIVNMAGQVVGLQSGLSIVALIDPTTSIETTLFSQIFWLFATIALLAAGMDHLILLSLLRTFRTLPPGSFRINDVATLRLVPMLSSILSAGLQLVVPLASITVFVELTVALLSRLSPYLPTSAVIVPLKTTISMVLMISGLAAWQKYLQADFGHVLDGTQYLLEHSFNPR